MSEHDLKCEAAMRAEAEYKPEPLSGRLEESGKLLDDSLELAGLIRAALISAKSLETPHSPVGNMRDLVNLNVKKILTLRETLVEIASVLGVWEVR